MALAHCTTAAPEPPGATHCDPLPFAVAVGEASADVGEAILPFPPPAAGVDDQHGSPTPLPLLIQASAAEKPDKATRATTITTPLAIPRNTTFWLPCMDAPHFPARAGQHLQQRRQTRSHIRHIFNGPRGGI